MGSRDVLAESKRVVCPPLTSRERELLALLVHEMGNQELASRLNIGMTTMKFHRSNLFNKLGVTTRPGAINTARALGLLPAKSSGS